MALPAESSSLSPKAQAVLQASRARTGFDSYRAYLDFHRKENPELEDLAAILGTPTEPNAEPPYTHRGPKQKSSLVLNVSTSWHLSVDHVHSDVDGTNIIEAICDPPKDAHLQIIVWNISPFTTMKFHGDLIDFLGLRFSLDPRVFLALYSAISLDNNNDENKRHENGLDRYVPTHVNMGNFIATVCHSRHQSDDIPVILIAGLRPSEFVHGQFDPCPPFSHSLTPGMQLEAIPTLGAYSLYPRSLIHLLERYSDAQADYDDLLLLCFLPLFQQSLVEIRYWCGAMRDTFSKGRRTDSTMDKRLEEDLYDQRAELRRDISKIEDRWSNFVRYMRLRLGWNPSSKPFYQDFEDDIKHFAGEANRLENEIREYLQLRAGILGVEAGRLGLEGSAKSFELSNLQMEEGKRVKTFTILAFVYVPLNLATSIYGMNLQQLNRSGQSVRDFVLTALFALIITGGAWYAAEAVNGYRKWQQERAQEPRVEWPEVPAPGYSVAERVAMIIWLLRKGHGSWMRTTGALPKILSNNRTPFLAAAAEPITLEPPFSAGALISKYSLGELEVELDSWAPLKLDESGRPDIDDILSRGEKGRQ